MKINGEHIRYAPNKSAELKDYYMLLFKNHINNMNLTKIIKK